MKKMFSLFFLCVVSVCSVSPMQSSGWSGGSDDAEEEDSAEQISDQLQKISVSQKKQLPHNTLRRSPTFSLSYGGSLWDMVQQWEALFKRYRQFCLWRIRQLSARKHEVALTKMLKHGRFQSLLQEALVFFQKNFFELPQGGEWVQKLIKAGVQNAPESVVQLYLFIKIRMLHQSFSEAYPETTSHQLYDEIIQFLCANVADLKTISYVLYQKRVVMVTQDHGLDEGFRDLFAELLTRDDSYLFLE